jgi:prepilin signal peptidase PulO-like enzyme (type II secretory pathway)
MLAAVGALFGWKGAIVALFGGSTIGAVIGIAALLVARRRAPPDEVAPETTPDEATAEAETEATADAPSPSLLRTELPFGPFLAMGALFYLFAEPWIQLYFRFPGG